MLCVKAGFAQDKLFEKYADMDNVTSVYISKAMFRMMPDMNNLGVNLAELKEKMESLQLINSEKTEQISLMRQDFSQLVQRGHQELMRIHNGKTNVTFYFGMKSDRIAELLMLADTDSSFTVIQLTGDFTLKDIQELTNKAKP
jgi:phosphopentomutase